MKFGFSKIFAVLCTAASSSLCASADAPGGYYDSLEGKTGVALKKAVKAIAKSHKEISYGNDTWDAFKSTDVRKVNGVDCWWDMYSSNNVEVSSGHPGMNIEHSIANSWWGGTKNAAYKDIVHLNPSNADANSRKSNYPIGEIGTQTWTNGVTFIGKPVSGQGGGNTYVYEPHDEYKGDFARVFMYMFTVYDDISWKSNTNWMYDTSSDVLLKPWAYNLLLKWSANDAVSHKELSRNDGVYKEQGNRNPFIDLPDLAEYIWGSKSGQPYHVEGAHTPDPVDPDPEDPDPVDPDPEDPDAVPGTFVLVASQADIRSGESYLIIARTSKVAMTLNHNQTYFLPSEAVTITDNTITSAPSDAALITLEAQGSGYALKASDLAGNFKGYVYSSGAKKVDLTNSAATEGATATLTWSEEGTAIVFGPSATSGAGALYYNRSSPRFTTYTSTGQERLDLYRKVKEESSVDEIDDDRCFVEVWGNNILLPEGARIFDLNGREVSGENLARGIYIVTKPGFKKAVKVMIY